MHPVVLLILTALTLAMTGANNASNSAGTIAGSKTASYRLGVVVFVVGLTLGLILEGSKLSGAIAGRVLMGALETQSLEIVLGVTFTMTLLATLLKLPMPVTQAVVGAVIGSAIYVGIPINIPGLAILLVSWIMTPFMAAGVTFIISKIIHRRIINSVNGSVAVYGIMTMMASFYTAYVFGANTLGLIAGIIEYETGWTLAIIITVVVTSAGGVLVGERVSKTVGERIASLGPPTAFACQFGGAMTVHFFTQGGIPVSISHAIVGAVFGGGLAKGAWALSRDTAIRLSVLWSSTPILTLGMAWLLEAVS